MSGTIDPNTEHTASPQNRHTLEQQHRVECTLSGLTHDEVEHIAKAGRAHINDAEVQEGEAAAAATAVNNDVAAPEAETPKLEPLVLVGAPPTAPRVETLEIVRCSEAISRGTSKPRQKLGHPALPRQRPGLWRGLWKNL